MRCIVSATHPIDDFTKQHLRQWLDRWLPWDRDQDEAFAKMVAVAEADPQIVEHGWVRVFDAAFPGGVA
jgi:hypothetical protein